MRWYSFFIASIPLLYISLIYANPIGALRFVARLKRRFRQHLIKRHGRILAEKRCDEVRRWAQKKGYNKEGVEQIIEETKEEIIEKFGTEYADKFLGRPNFIEENF